MLCGVLRVEAGGIGCDDLYKVVDGTKNNIIETPDF
jgi:hypothetical protein